MPTSKTPRILGLDPGLQVTGYGILEMGPTGPTVLEAGVLRSEVGREAADMAQRVKTLYDSLIEVLDQWTPTVMCVEQLFAHYDHPRTAILMAHARGCFFLAGAQRGLEVISYAATRVKKIITGHGRASKEQMQHAIMRELNLSQLPEPADVSDALAVALCHLYLNGNGIMGGARSATFMGVNRAALLNSDDDAEDDIL
jgi:crossover junction endodeoxyribonuclease RuvC